jgi:hypothetical protein
MSNSTQTYKLFEVLKSGEPVSVTKIAEELKVKIPSVPVYIHGLKKAKAEITAIREGRKVVSYQMVDSSQVNISEHRKNSAAAIAKAKSVSKNSATLIPLEDGAAPVSIGEREMADTLDSLGVESFSGHSAD